MQNGNGKSKWVHYLVGTITTIILMAFLFMGRSVVANDRLSRERDDKIATEARAEKTELRKEINAELKEINSSNMKILIAIAELKKDIQSIKQ